MRTATSDMITTITSEAPNLARVWTFVRKRDGKMLFLTDHDQDIIVGAVKYQSNVGLITSATVTSSTQFTSQTCELQLPTGPATFTEQEIRARLWEGSSATMGIVDFTNPTSVLNLFTGNFGRIMLTERGRVTIEMQALGSRDLYLATDLYSYTCRNSLGDKKCMVNLEALRVDFTVELIVDDYTFVVDRLPSQSAGWFSMGQLVWDTGGNAGQMSEVQTSTLTQELGIFYLPQSVIQVGDTGHVYPGCDLLITTCQAKFNNVINFNGEPWSVQPQVAPLPASTMQLITGQVIPGATVHGG